MSGTGPPPARDEPALSGATLSVGGVSCAVPDGMICVPLRAVEIEIAGHVAGLRGSGRRWLGGSGYAAGRRVVEAVVVESQGAGHPWRAAQVRAAAAGLRGGCLAFGRCASGWALIPQLLVGSTDRVVRPRLTVAAMPRTMLR